MITDMSTREFLRAPRFNLGHPLDPADIRVGIPLLVAPFRSGREFLASLHRDARNSLRLVMPTRTQLEAGEDVVLEVMWPGLPNRVYLRAATLGRTRSGKLMLELYQHEQPKLHFLFTVATDPTACPHRRRHPRYCVRLPLEWRAFGRRTMTAGTAEDLSVGGIHIATHATPIDRETSVVVRLHADSVGQDLVLTGKIRHVHPRGEQYMALGVEFEAASTGELKELRRLLRAFATNGVVLFE